MFLLSAASFGSLMKRLLSFEVSILTRKDLLHGSDDEDGVISSNATRIVWYDAYRLVRCVPSGTMCTVWYDIYRGMADVTYVLR